MHHGIQSVTGELVNTENSNSLTDDSANNDLSNDWTNLKKRYLGLDIFRIVSVIVICAFHTTIHLGANYGILQPLSQMGAVFMTAFFMMSGYLLFTSNSSKNAIKLPNLKTFFLKRIIGIIPMYYIASLLFIVFNYISAKVFGYGEYSIINELFLAPIEMLGIQSNFHTIFLYSHNGGTWFISCLLMCYLIYPFMQEITKQLSNKIRVILVVLLVAILLYAPIIQNRFQTVNIYANPFFRILEFSIGVILASMKPYLDSRKFVKKIMYNWITILIVNVIMVVSVIIGVKLEIAIGDYMLYSIVCLPCFIIMLVGLSGIESPVLSRSKLIKYCSGLGYAFFLAQLFSNRISQIIIQRAGITNNLLIILVGWTVCIVISILLHEILEKPIKKVLTKKLKC